MSNARDAPKAVIRLLLSNRLRRPAAVVPKARAKTSTVASRPRTSTGPIAIASGQFDRPASKVAPQIRQSVWSSSFSSSSPWAQIYGVTVEREGLALGATNGAGRDWSGSDADANPKSVAVEVARRSEKYEARAAVTTRAECTSIGTDELSAAINPIAAWFTTTSPARRRFPSPR